MLQDTYDVLVILNPRLVEFPGCELVGVRTTTPSSFTNEVSLDPWPVGELFRSLSLTFTEHDVIEPEIRYGVSWPADQNVPPLVVHYFAGVESATDFGDSFESLIVPAGNYFAVTFRGSLQEMDSAFQQAYGEVIEGSGLLQRDGLHLEMYDGRFDATSERSEMEILIPVQ